MGLLRGIQRVGCPCPTDCVCVSSADYVYFENSSSNPYLIRRIEELNKVCNSAWWCLGRGVEVSVCIAFCVCVSL